MTTFEKCCDAIEAQKKLSDKKKALAEFKDYFSVKHFLYYVFNPTCNFNILLSDVEGYANLTEDEITEVFGGLINKKFPPLLDYKIRDAFLQRNPFGKWFTRLINHSLRLGLGMSSVEEVLGITFPRSPLMIPDEIKFGLGESFPQLVHHLEDSSNWSIYGMKKGITCMVDIRNGRCLFSTDSPLNIIHTENIEKELLEIFKDQTIILHGKLFLGESEFIKDPNDIKEVYRVFASNDCTAWDLQTAYFQIQDIISSPEEDYSARASQLLATVVKYTDLMYVSVSFPKLINYKTDQQVWDLVKQGYTKAYLVYNKSLYVSGRNRSFLTLKI